LRRVPRQELAGQQGELFDVFASTERAGQRPRYPRVGTDNALEGPFNANLLNPAIGLAWHQFGNAMRYESTLTDRSREFVILAVAAAWDSAYERYAHEDIGRAVGLSEDELRAVAAGEVPVTASEDEQAVIRVAQLLVSSADLDDAQYAGAVGALGERRLFEVLTLVGAYSATALNLRVFRVEPPAHR
jgi:4-carboxymuconolactone decarboxylase